MDIRAIGRSPVVVSGRFVVIISCCSTFTKFLVESEVLRILIVIAYVSSILGISGHIWM